MVPHVSIAAVREQLAILGHDSIPDSVILRCNWVSATPFLPCCLIHTCCAAASSRRMSSSLMMQPSRKLQGGHRRPVQGQSTTRSPSDSWTSAAGWVSAPWGKPNATTCRKIMHPAHVPAALSITAGPSGRPSPWAWASVTSRVLPVCRAICVLQQRWQLHQLSRHRHAEAALPIQFSNVCTPAGAVTGHRWHHCSELSATRHWAARPQCSAGWQQTMCSRPCAALRGQRQHQ